MSESLTKLKARIAQISLLGQASGLLDWDQQTYMPSGAAAGRAEQTATLSRFIHELFVSALGASANSYAATEAANASSAI